MSDHTVELEPSELGTREYWSDTYKQDIKNFLSHGDVGEEWFGEDYALRLTRWIISNIIVRNKFIVDLGCGNGMLLIGLAREGYTNLMGVDYCQDAIDLCKSIVKSQQIDTINFKVADLTDDFEHLEGFDIALDKGTYDAISLNPEETCIKRCKYIKNVAKILKPRGIFIITSCNWTENEIIQHFKEDFNLQQILPTPKFQFGGKVGSLVSSLVLEKRS